IVQPPISTAQTLHLTGRGGRAYRSQPREHSPCPLWGVGGGEQTRGPALHRCPRRPRRLRLRDMSSVSRTGATPDITLDEALDRFLASFATRVARGGRSPATLAMHADHAGIIRRSLPAGLSLVALADHHVEQLAAAAVSGGTIRKRLGTLYGALEAARRRGE